MVSIIKRILKELIPPILMRGLSILFQKIRKMINPRALEGKEQNSDWYDIMYKSNKRRYLCHYSESNYYFLWSVLGDRFMKSGIDNILDLGCGPGQFASLLYDKGIKHYCGIDFSPHAIKLAKQVCPSFEFKTIDIVNGHSWETFDYDCIVTMEFLEHVEVDLKVLNKIKPGTKVYITVPNFPYPSHVRHFSTTEEVISRYENLFSDFQVDKFLENPDGIAYYLIEGTKS